MHIINVFHCSYASDVLLRLWLWCLFKVTVVVCFVCVVVTVVVSIHLVLSPAWFSWNSRYGVPNVYVDDFICLLFQAFQEFSLWPLPFYSTTFSRTHWPQQNFFSASQVFILSITFVETLIFQFPTTESSHKYVVSGRLYKKTFAQDASSGTESRTMWSLSKLLYFK